jgi:hypothetical protein
MKRTTDELSDMPTIAEHVPMVEVVLLPRFDIAQITQISPQHNHQQILTGGSPTALGLDSVDAMQADWPESVPVR